MLGNQMGVLKQRQYYVVTTPTHFSSWPHRSASFRVNRAIQLSSDQRNRNRIDMYIQAFPLKSMPQSSTFSVLLHCHLNVNNQGKGESYTLRRTDSLSTWILEWLYGEILLPQHTLDCTRMFIAVLFITLILLKQPKCSLLSEWIKQLIQWHTIQQQKEMSYQTMQRYE